MILFRSAAILAVFCAFGAVYSGGENRNDPLLRENWSQQESLKARGLFFRISSVLEKMEAHAQIQDAGGRTFEIDRRGRVSFNPLEDNWRPVVPRTSDATLHLAEADALLRAGLKSEALFLYRSIVSMDRNFPEAPAAVRRASADSTVRINRMKTDLLLFEDYERDSDPYIFFNDIDELTVIASDRFGWRVTLPGSFRYMPSMAARERESMHSVVYAGSGNINITIGSDLRRRAWELPDTQALMSIWDLRRSLSPQRQQSLDFQRSIPPYENEFCSQTGSVSGGRTERGRLFCAVRESGFLGEVSSIDFYSVRAFQGFYLNITFPPGEKESAVNIMRFVLEKIHFSSN